MAHIVVIGAGQAGASIVGTLRAEGFDGDVTLVGSEPHPPYQRPPLSKAYLLGEMARDRLFLRPESWYGDQNIRLMTGVEADTIDPVARTVRVGEERLDWDHLVIATGLRPRALGSDQGGDLGGVFTLRSLADIDRLRPALAEARRMLVVGGGYIGLEGAAVARTLGLGVTVVEAGPRILGRVAAAETADHFRALHQARGVEIREGVALDRLLGSGRVTGARLADGSEIAADIVIAGIGMSPRVAIAEAAGIETDGGVVVDALGRTSVPGIWAAGDCAALPFRGTRIRLESVQNAVDMGAAVARNMLGRAVPYHPEPWFWSDQYDAHLQIAGLNLGYDSVVRRQGGAGLSHWYYAGDRLVAVDAVNDARAYMVGKRLLAMGKTPPAGALRDAGTDLKALLKA